MEKELKPMTAGRAARALLKFYNNDESRWTQGAYARSKRGRAIGPKEENAVCWCMAGAVRRILPGNLSVYEAEEHFTRVMIALLRKMYDGAVLFNDNHSFDEVQAKLRELSREP